MRRFASVMAGILTVYGRQFELVRVRGDFLLGVSGRTVEMRV